VTTQLQLINIIINTEFSYTLKKQAPYSSKIDKKKGLVVWEKDTNYNKIPVIIPEIAGCENPMKHKTFKERESRFTHLYTSNKNLVSRELPRNRSVLKNLDNWANGSAI